MSIFGVFLTNNIFVLELNNSIKSNTNQSNDMRIFDRNSLQEKTHGQ